MRQELEKLPLGIFKNFIAVDLIYDVVLISAVQQSDSYIYILHIYIFFSRWLIPGY